MTATAIPILPSADFDRTASFYAGFGFEERGRWTDEYLIIGHERHGIELHFWFNPAVDRWTNDVACYLRFPDPDAARSCHGDWGEVEVPAPAVFSTLDDGPAPGSIEFHIIDLDGNLVRVGGFPPA